MNATKRVGLERMTPTERRSAVALSGIYSLRMMGLFMIFPILSLYVDKLPGATTQTIGIALGVYGLTQGLLQIPFGLLSDRWGRKPVIVLGLLIFCLGSVIAALADSITGVIIGRALQGGGAVAAAIMALAADLTREEHRTKAMAMIGSSIGASFALALVLGPVLNGLMGLAGIFWLTAAFAVIAIGVLLGAVPHAGRRRVQRDAEPVPAQFLQVLRDTQLLRLDAGIFILHMILTATFLSLPLALLQAGVAEQRHWWVYLPVLLLSVACMVPFIIVAERRRRMKSVFVGAIVVLGLGQLGMALWHTTLPGLIFALFVFFTAFNLLEASLPSLISKLAPAASKGTAMGFYSSSQFLGAFAGGTTGGVLLAKLGIQAVFMLGAGLTVLWLLLALSMRPPRYLRSLLLRVGVVAPTEADLLAARLTQVQGVAEAVVVAQEGVAYLKVESHALDERALQAFAASDA